MSQELKQIQREICVLEKVLALKPLKGAVFPERVRCCKEGCTRCPHGPYYYLSYWDPHAGRPRRKYLGKDGSKYFEMDREEILQCLEDLRGKEAEILGQLEEGGCKKCAHLTTLTNWPFCKLLQAFLAHEVLSKPCDIRGGWMTEVPNPDSAKIEGVGEKPKSES